MWGLDETNTWGMHSPALDSHKELISYSYHYLIYIFDRDTTGSCTGYTLYQGPYLRGRFMYLL